MAKEATAPKETITARMSRWAAGVEFKDLSKDAVYQAKRYLLDSVGCALGGYQQHDVKIALEVLDEIAGRGPSTVIGTGKRMDPVTTGQIYWGAVPFVVIQVIMVLLVIMFPSMVMHYKGALSTIDPNTIKIEIPQMDAPPLDFGPPAK